MSLSTDQQNDSSQFRESSPRGQVFTTIVVSGFAILAGMLGMVNQMVQANIFGTSVEMDSYIAAVAWPVFFSGLMPTVIIALILPILMRFPEGGQRDRISGILFLLLGCFACLFVVIGGTTSQFIILPGMLSAQNDTLSIAIESAWLVWGASGLGIMVSFISAIYYARTHFYMASLSFLFTPLFMIISALFLEEWFGIKSLAIGLLAGNILQFCVLLPGWLLHFKPLAGQALSFEIKIALRHFIPALLSQLPFAASPMIAAFWGAKLPAGSLSYMNYSFSLAGFLSVGISSGLATVAFPRLAESIVNKNYIQAMSGFEKRLRVLLLIAIPTAAFVIALRDPLIRFGLLRGAFDNSSVLGTARVMPWFLIAMVAITCLNLIRNLYYSFGAYYKTAWLGCGTVVVYFIGSGLLSTRLSYVGIGVAFAISYWFFLAASIIWLPDMPFFLYKNGFPRFLVKTILISSFSAGLTAVTNLILSSTFGFCSPFPAFLIGACLFLVLAKNALPELWEVANILWSFRRKKIR